MKRLLMILLFIPALLYGQGTEVNEDELFGDSGSVVDNTIQDNTKKDEMDQRSAGISGKITGAFSYSGMDDTEINSMTDDSPFRPYMVGDLYLDVRMPGGYKGFGSFELVHDASIDEDETGEKQNTFALNEFFVDFNIARHVYFRAGKQVLQWGQCYLWNPTDMINIENKSFVTTLEEREGTYGVKMHIPFGTAVNIYGFAGMNRTEKLREISGAGKFEFLIKNTEMAFSVWGKNRYRPVYGYDFSGRLFSIDIKGEASYSHGSNTYKVIDDSGMLTAEKDRNANIFKASLNIGRDFDFGEKADRINVSMEFFYNGDGYSENPAEDDNTYIYDDTDFTFNGETVTIPGGSKELYILGHGYYVPNYISKYYAALFFTFSEFIISDMTLTVNGISNIQQKSFIASAGLSYSNINNFTAGISGNAYLGNKEGEYRAAGSRYNVLVTAGIIF